LFVQSTDPIFHKVSFAAPFLAVYIVALRYPCIASFDGCIPIAAGAFIGEHSFSSDKRPIALGRPDQHDLSQAEAFGRTIKEKLDALQAIIESSGFY
jgi:hypothetical protein